MDVTGTSQSNIAEEIEDLARKRLGPNTSLSFQVHPFPDGEYNCTCSVFHDVQDTWKLRAVCVKGERDTL